VAALKTQGGAAVRDCLRGLIRSATAGHCPRARDYLRRESLRKISAARLGLGNNPPHRQFTQLPGPLPSPGGDFVSRARSRPLGEFLSGDSYRKVWVRESGTGGLSKYHRTSRSNSPGPMTTDEAKTLPSLKNSWTKSRAGDADDATQYFKSTPCQNVLSRKVGVIGR
jgi:hypothetical protein